MRRLIGRRTERDAIDRRLRDALAGHPSALAIRGGGGTGKTALLDWASTSTSARDFDVSRLVASSSERLLPYAGLEHLVGEVSDVLPTLPSPQADALGAALGLRPGADGPPDIFLVGLATLAVVARRSRDRPVLWVVDDAHLLDATSAQALAFVARRLGDERVLILVAEPSRSGTDELATLDEIHLRGLGGTEGRALLGALVPGLVDDVVMARIVAEAGGLPGVMAAACQGLTAVDLGGGFEPSGPTAGRVGDDLRRRSTDLAPPARRLLLLAALDPMGEPGLLERAAPRLGIRQREFRLVVDHRLLRLGGRVTFVDPLLRSFVVEAAGPDDVRRAHRALWKALPARTHPDRKAWHRAHAAPRPSEAVARDLLRQAPRARLRGGAAAEAAFLAAAATATADGDRRARRALAAADAMYRAGAPNRAADLLQQAEQGALDPLDRVLALRLRALTTPDDTTGAHRAGALLAAARECAALDPTVARRLHLEAVEASLAVDRGRDATAEIARAGLEVDGADDGDATGALLGWFAVEAERRGPADVEALLEGVGAVSEQSRWAGLAIDALAASWHQEAATELAHRATRHRRETGELALLGPLLDASAVLAVEAGETATAAALIEEGADLASASGLPGGDRAALLLSAWRGDGGAVAAFAGPTGDVPTGGGAAIAARALLANSRLDPSRLGELGEAGTHSSSSFGRRVLVEWAETAARAGDRAALATAMERLRASAEASGTDLALGLLARCEALAADGRSATDAFEAAIAHLDRTPGLLEQARTHLYFGEWLETTEGPGRGEPQLGMAAEVFRAVGAEVFTRRAAPPDHGGTPPTRPTAPPPTVAEAAPTRPDLTDQEARIAEMVVAGRSNPEIAAELHISRRTVEYHLHKVFIKTGVTSRHALAAVLQP